MANTRWLSKVLKWVFAVFTVLMGVAAVAVVAVMVIDPQIPAGMTKGPWHIEAFGHPGTISITNETFAASMVRGGLQVKVDDAAGLLEIVKHYGLPIALLNILCFAVLFDLLRRLFRNVGRGESFTRQTVRLVQSIGFSLLGFSVILAVAEGWFHMALFDYLSQHATFEISGTAVRLPPSGEHSFSSGSGSPFGSPMFFTGLLVLALSEVFRQGLALKNENDLTV